MNVGIVGCGSIGSRHARNVKVLGHAVYLCDRDGERAQALAHDLKASDYPVCSFSSLDGFAEQPLKAVLVCTPASTHRQVAAVLMLNGYDGPLFVEKPLAEALVDAEAFLRWPSLVQMVGYNWRFNTEVSAFLRKHQDVDQMCFRCNARMSEWPGAEYGDPLLEMSHEVDLAVRFELGYRLLEAGSVYDSSVYLKSERTLVDLRWDAEPARLCLACYGSPLRTGDACWPTPESVEASYVAELRHFLDCAERGVATDCPFLDGVEVVRICEQARELSGGSCAPFQRSRRRA